MSASCFAAGLSLVDLAVDVDAGVIGVAVLDDTGYVEHAVDSPVATEVEPVWDREAVAFT